MIEVRLFATFREGREKIQFFEANSFPDTGKIIDYLNIPLDEVAILLINGKHSRSDVPLKDGDVVALFPPVGGG